MSTSRLFNVFVALALVMVAVLTVRAGVATSNLVNSGTSDAETARWTAMAQFYARQTQEAARIQRVQEADTARWVALGKIYARLEAQRSQRVQDAETARWQALGEFYARQAQEAQRIQRVQEADAARWTAQHGGTNRTCVLLCGGW